MEKKKSKKKFVILALVLLLFVSVGVGFAYLQKVLNIGGTGTISSDFNVVIDSVTETAGADLGAGVVSGDTVTFTVTLEKPGDTYTATVTVKNTGTLTAKFISITTGSGNTATTGTDIVSTFTTAVAPNTSLATNAEHEFTFNFAWTETSGVQTVPGTTTFTFAYTIEYQQA